MNALSVAVNVKELGESWTQRNAGIKPYKDGDPVMFNNLSLHGTTEELRYFALQIQIRLLDSSKPPGAESKWAESIPVPKLATQEEIEALAQEARMDAFVSQADICMQRLPQAAGDTPSEVDFAAFYHTRPGKLVYKEPSR